VAQDGEQPTLSVSLGVAMYPQDGATTDALLAAADRSLYENKALAHRAATAAL
jgi:GGDEF domain-containing protein